MADRLDFKLIGSRIKSARENKRWTQKELGEEVGLTQAGIDKIEKGQSRVKLDNLYRIADALGVRVVDLIGSDTDLSDNTKPTEADMLRDIWLALKRSRIITNLTPEEIEEIKGKLNRVGDHPEIETLTDLWPHFDAAERRNIYDYILWRLRAQLERLNSSEKRGGDADEYTIGLLNLFEVINKCSPEERRMIGRYLQRHP